MADKTTWIKIDRNIERWRWYQDGNTFRVFIHLLLQANIKDNGFQFDTIHRGELATSIGHIAKAVGITYNQARTALNHLKQTNEITTKTRPKYLVISIVNYDRYQDGHTQTTSKSQADHKQTTTIKEYKESKERKNIYTPSAETDTKAASSTQRVDYGGVWLNDNEWNELAALVPSGEKFIEILDRVSTWLEDNPRPKNRHKGVVKTFMRNDGLI